jgi:peptidoglycan/xylan/chitin deacetylase (PgdA/CDA1 family)
VLLRLKVLGLAALVAAAGASADAMAACTSTHALGTHRNVEIDTRQGPLYGDFTKQSRQPSFLADKEVVLTFDDGPMPWITKSILDTLDHFCVKATFFSVGRMAMAYPDTVKDVVARGHTLGTHTWSHPMHMRSMRPDQSADQMDRGFAAVAAAAGRPIAPFFRFPGLSDSASMLAHLQSRGVATFTVDVVSNDSYIADAKRLARETIAKVEARRGGIILFHDIKASTARALPTILGELKARGYRVVHMLAKTPYAGEPHLAAEYRATIEKAELARGGRTKSLVPFYGQIGPDRDIATGATAAPVEASTAGRVTTQLAPQVPAYTGPQSLARSTEASAKARSPFPDSSDRVSSVSASGATDGWTATVKRPRTRNSKTSPLRERTQF